MCYMTAATLQAWQTLPLTLLCELHLGLEVVGCHRRQCYLKHTDNSEVCGAYYDLVPH